MVHPTRTPPRRLWRNTGLTLSNVHQRKQRSSHYNRNPTYNIISMTSNYSGSIPGLNREHFTCSIIEDGDHRLCIPTLTKSKIYSDGQSFYFSWTASYGRKEKYYLQATGNIAKGDQWKNNGPKWWGFECRCSCPDFAEQEDKTIASNYMEHHVCHHLQIALELCVDFMANNSPPSPKSVVETTPSLPAPPPSMERGGGLTRRTVSPLIDTTPVAQIIIPGLTRLHFIDDSTWCTCRRAPIITKADINKGGEFTVHWQATGEIDDDDENECYNLRASGNIKLLEKQDGPQWWGFSVSCDCPEFLRQRLRCDTESGWTQNFVCPHVGRALELARDPERMSNYNEGDDSAGEDSMDALLSADPGGSECSSTLHGMDALLAVDGSDGSGIEAEKSMDAFPAVDDSDGSSTLEDEDSMHALLAVDDSDGSTCCSSTLQGSTLQAENSLFALLSTVDSDSVDGSTMSGILSVE